MPSAGSFRTRLSIVNNQVAQVGALLDELIGKNPFYTRKLQLANTSRNIRTLAQFCEAVPLTTKPELIEDQKASSPYGTNLTYPLDRYTRCHQTSGSTGKPLLWLDTAQSWDWMLTSWGQIYQAAGVAGTDRIFFAFSFGPFLGFWTAFESALRIGCLCLPGGGLSSGARLSALLQHGITVLCSTPTYAMHLGQVAAEQGASKDSKVRLIIVAGEPGGSVPATRAQLEQLWPGARVYDHHGMTEVGPVSYECPSRPGVLHVMEDAFIAEVIDPQSGVHLNPGAQGELVLTTLRRLGSPLLRYRTGDLVKASLQSVCECGRADLALEGGILGRADDMIVIRGVNVYPSAIEEIIRKTGAVAEYQVHVDTAHGLAQMSIVVEPRANQASVTNLVPTLESDFQTALALRIPVTLVDPGTLPRPEGKAKRWIKT